MVLLLKLMLFLTGRTSEYHMSDQRNPGRCAVYMPLSAIASPTQLMHFHSDLPAKEGIAPTIISEKLS
jgi:hypothetical protein